MIAHAAQIEPFAYRMPSPRVWYAREGLTRQERIRAIRRRTDAQETRSPHAPAQSTSDEVRITRTYADCHSISTSSSAFEPDPDVIDAIADALADAIWADVYGAK